MNKWVETTLRKGTKSPKICRDMYITNCRGEYALCSVKNGALVTNEKITVSEVRELRDKFSLVYVASTIFENYGTYRTKKSNELVASTLFWEGVRRGVAASEAEAAMNKEGFSH